MKSVIFLLVLVTKLAYFKTVLSEEPSCNQAFLGRLGNGVITSYNFPFDYRHNLTCTYSIALDMPPEGTKIVCLTFYRFELESSTPFCSFDYLKLEYPNLKYCGKGLWQYGTQTGNREANVWSRDFCFTVKGADTFDMMFSSDNNINGSGFYATYAVYDGATTTQDQIQASPGQAPCTEEEWTCFNRKCINPNQLCDGRDDCQDGSDESYAHARCGSENVLACDFSSNGVSDGYCEFAHEGWFRTQQQHSPYGPQGDHTNGTEGHYVYTDINHGSAYLLSPELALPPNRSHCLSFWYYIYGTPAKAVLSVYVSRDQAYSRPEWKRVGGPENRWVRAQLLIKTQSLLQVIFAAELDNSFSGVALDDISLMEGSCFGSDISCNFESSTCGWQASNNISHHHGSLHGDLQWRIHNRLLAPVGPFWDHSARDGGGYYLYFNYSSKPSNGRALIVSPAVSSSRGSLRCFSFWYQMMGLDSDCCQLKVKVHGADNVMTEAVWSQHGDIRNAWMQASVELTYDGPFQLILEGTVSSASRGEIGVDEVAMTEGRCTMHTDNTCEAGQFLCTDGHCINATLKCNGHQDCLDGSDEGPSAACPTLPPSTIPTTIPVHQDPCPGKFQCVPDTVCIPLRFRCDGFFDCDNKADEQDCPGVTTQMPPGGQCRSNQFRCKNGDCIAGGLQCNSATDCTDNSDESSYANCSAAVFPPVPTDCLASEFACLGGSIECISRQLLCDGSQDCSDGSDEDQHHAQCPGVHSSVLGLGTGAIVGIAVGCVLCVAIVVLSALLGRRRRKPCPRRHNSSHTESSQGIATISVTNAAESTSTMERHMSMLESMREPMQQISQPPPYTERQLENMGYTSDGTLRTDRGVALPPDEPPPPYDAVLKEQMSNIANQARQRVAGAGSSSQSSQPTTTSGSSESTPGGSSDNLASQRSRNNSLANNTSSSTSSPLPAVPLLRPSPSDPRMNTIDSRRSIGSEHIYEEPATLLRPSSSAHNMPTQPYVPQLPDRPPLRPLNTSSDNFNTPVSSNNYPPISYGGNFMPNSSVGNFTPSYSPGNFSPSSSAGNFSLDSSSGNFSPGSAGGNFSPGAYKTNYPHAGRIRLGTKSLQPRTANTYRPRQFYESNIPRDQPGGYNPKPPHAGYTRLNLQEMPPVPPGANHYPLSPMGQSQTLAHPSSRQPEAAPMRRQSDGRKSDRRRDMPTDVSAPQQQGSGGSRRHPYSRPHSMSFQAPPPNPHHSGQQQPRPESSVPRPQGLMARPPLPNQHLPGQHQQQFSPNSSSALSPRARTSHQQYPPQKPRPSTRNTSAQMHQTPPTISSSAEQDHIFLSPIGSSSTDPYHPRMDSTESFGGCSTSPLMINSSHEDSEDMEILSPTSV